MTVATRPLTPIQIVLLPALCLLCACTGKKVDLPSEAPQVPVVSSENKVTSGFTETAAASPASSAASSTASPASASDDPAPTTATATTAQPPHSGMRVSGQVNSGKQGQASFKIAGHIAKTVAQVGEKIRRGQTLAILDDTDVQLRLKLAQNQL
ncbi:MAG: hypothetical protein RL189_1457, partial [Pseudomonadota bacterium]